MTIFTKLKTKFASFRKEKVTMMIVPHNQKGVKNISLSYWKFITFFFVCFFIFSFSIITVGRYTYYVVREQVYIAQHKKFVNKMGHIINDSGKLIEAQQGFNKMLNDLLNNLGLRSAISLKSDVGGPLNPISDALKNNKISPSDKKELEEMQELTQLMEISKNAQQVGDKVKKLAHKVKSFESVTRYIPSIWPLLGDGQITKDANGMMEVSTLPFTPVVASAEGKVAGVTFTGKGIKITMLHKYQFISIYNGLCDVAPIVKKDAIIHKGQVIGYVGKSHGRSLLHYGVFVGNDKGLYPADPNQFSYLGR